MKKLLVTLAMAPLALTACSADAPKGIVLPQGGDEKQEVVRGMLNAMTGLKSTDLTKIKELCDTYFDTTTKFDGSTKACSGSEGYFATAFKDAELYGTESAIKAFEWKDTTEVAGQFKVGSLIKTETKITNQAQFDKTVAAAVAQFPVLGTVDELSKKLTDGFAEDLAHGYNNFFYLKSVGGKFKITEWNKNSAAPL